MTDKKKPVDATQSFKSVCVIQDKPDGKGIQVTAYGNDGKALATGDAFRKQGIIDNFIDNMEELLSVGGKAVGDSRALGRTNAATTKEDGMAINVAKGICDVSTVDRGGIAEGTMRMGVVLKGANFTAEPKP